MSRGLPIALTALSTPSRGMFQRTLKHAPLVEVHNHRPSIRLEQTVSSHLIDVKVLLVQVAFFAVAGLGLVILGTVVLNIFAGSLVHLSAGGAD